MVDPAHIMTKYTETVELTLRRAAALLNKAAADVYRTRSYTRAIQLDVGSVVAHLEPLIPNGPPGMDR